MYRAFLLMVAIEAVASVDGAEAAVDLAAIDRSIVKEPVYQAEPHYALLVIGPNAEHRAWFVLDGNEVAYLDRNDNGDLTDAGERIELDRKATEDLHVASSHGVVGMNVFSLGEVAGCELTFQLWIRDPAYEASQDETLRDYPEFSQSLHDMRELKLQNGSLYRAAADGMRAQIPLALTLEPESAQVCHLLGPITFALKWDDRQRLEPWPKRTVLDVNLGTRGLPPKGWTHGGFDFAPLTTSEVPENVEPVAKIEYAAVHVGQPKSQELILNERCCGDTFYTTFGVPQGVSTGEAMIAVSVPFWPDHVVKPLEVNVPINRELSRTNECSYVLFHDPQIEPKDAVNVLRRAKLNVFIREDVLLIEGEAELRIGIRLNRAPEVQEVARELGDGTEFASELGRCDARFEIGPYQADNEAAIRQIESLLQELTEGFAYHTWDQQLLEPR